MDPDILAIRAEARERIKQLQKTRNSGTVLKHICEKLLPRLTPDDTVKLRDRLSMLWTDQELGKKHPDQIQAEALEGPTMTEPAAPAESEESSKDNPWLTE